MLNLLIEPFNIYNYSISTYSPYLPLRNSIAYQRNINSITQIVSKTEDTVVVRLQNTSYQYYAPGNNFKVKYVNYIAQSTNQHQIQHTLKLEQIGYNKDNYSTRTFKVIEGNIDDVVVGLQICEPALAPNLAKAFSSQADDTADVIVYDDDMNVVWMRTNHNRKIEQYYASRFLFDAVDITQRINEGMKYKSISGWKTAPLLSSL